MAAETITPMAEALRSAVTQAIVPGFYFAATYQQVTPGVYDPFTSTLTAPTVVKIPVLVRVEAYAQHELVPDVILPTDRKIILQQAEYPEEPSPQHEVRARDVLYSIVGVTEEAPGITWTIHGRRKGRTP